MLVRAILILVIAVSLSAQTPPAPPPFSIELVKVDATFPGLHSYALARGSDGKWLLAGGRTNGIHKFVSSSDNGTTPPPNAFPVEHANRSLWVIDPVAKRSWSSSVTALSQPIADALSATNAQGVQNGNMLYIIGGYGWDTKSETMTTFGTLTAIQVDETIAAIVAGRPVAQYIQQTSTYYDCIAYSTTRYNACLPQEQAKCQPGPGWQECLAAAAEICRQKRGQAVDDCIAKVRARDTADLPTNTGYYARVAGGGMEMIGDTYYLVFGQNFQGLYSSNEADYGKWPVDQVYTQRVVALDIQPKPLSAAVLNVVQHDPNDLSSPYHRRDLNVLPLLAPDGSERIAALGGVFRPGQDTAYQEPILIEASTPASIGIDVDTYKQFMSQYECATVLLFDRTNSRMTAVLIGGISLYKVARGRLHIDTTLPFIRAITALTRLPDGTWTEFVRVKQMEDYTGANAKFIRNPRLPASKSGILYLDAIKERTLAGWMYGGIKTEAEDVLVRNQGSIASPDLYEVWLDPEPPGTAYWLSTIGAPGVILGSDSTPAPPRP